MDMSKAFWSIHRSVIMEDLGSNLLPEEIYLFKLAISIEQAQIFTEKRQEWQSHIEFLSCSMSRVKHKKGHQSKVSKWKQLFSSVSRRFIITQS